ncbi:M14 family metallopeptidase [Ramlibacter tataouinensis]|uniref:M14 family metallopeptidase n=1 Tax=Ramlibacter tataouinensis TaxID=94132 RepID=UPI0022F3A5DF|nr:M14 family metallopeptidase [Ramlibacter tataouinensis]WBY00542.1 M14 family metallopeptidase [Ramlibacter tataouinensis]
MSKIGEFLKASGGARLECGRIPVGSMASGMSVDLPYVAVRGAEPGKTLWINGQVHGDEINGMIASLRFARALDPTKMRGNVVVTPTANPHALDFRRKRNPYDELDLDQSFPGSAKGLISERLSHALFAQIRGVADMLVSLHTMNPLFDSRLYAVYKVHPDSGVSEQDQLKALSVFNPNVACRQNVAGAGELPGNIAGGIDYQALAAGIPAFMVELGGGSRYEAHNVEAAVLGFRRLAAALDILPAVAGDWPPRSLRRVTKRHWVTFEKGGLFTPEVEAGSTVDGGTVIGRTMDLFGEPIESFVAQGPSVVFGLRRDPVVHTGERAAFVATEWDSVLV